MDREKFELGYHPGLNGIRGLAILAVVVFHAWIPFRQTKFLVGGYIGVDIFFVLSGFLITTLLLKEHEQNGRINLAQFYMRRLLRLMPALLAMLLVFVGISYMFLSGDRFESHVVDSLITLFYASNWTRAFGLERPEMLGHTWSLSIEEQFYVCWPLMLIFMLRFLVSRQQIMIAVGVGILLSWALRAGGHWSGVDVMRLYNGTDTRADSLLMGCFLALALSCPRFLQRLKAMTGRVFGRRISLSLVSTVGLILVAMTQPFDSPFMYYWGFFSVELLSATLILDVVLFNGSFCKGVFENKALIEVGRISYGIYLWHNLIFLTMVELGFNTLQIVTLGVAASFALAWLSFWFLEEPLLRLKKRYRSSEAPVSGKSDFPMAFKKPGKVVNG